jgi:hypothetical protein
MRNDSIWIKMGPKVHGYLDYGFVVLTALAPSLFGFEGTPRNACYMLAAVQLGMSLLTAYPLGAVRMIPFTVHATIEFMTALLLIGLPWIADFNAVDSARNFFVASGLGLLALWSVTDYRLAERGPATVPDKLERKITQSVGR